LTSLSEDQRPPRIGHDSEFRSGDSETQSVDIAGVQTPEDWIYEPFNDLATKPLADVFADADISTNITSWYQGFQSRPNQTTNRHHSRTQNRQKALWTRWTNSRRKVAETTLRPHPGHARVGCDEVVSQTQFGDKSAHSWRRSVHGLRPHIDKVTGDGSRSNLASEHWRSLEDYDSHAALTKSAGAS
jgi:hypothetical protein